MPEEYTTIAERMLGHAPDDRLLAMLSTAAARVRVANYRHDSDLRSTQVIASIIAIWEATCLLSGLCDCGSTHGDSHDPQCSYRKSR
jgi:hypothetical protein